MAQQDENRCGQKWLGLTVSENLSLRYGDPVPIHKEKHFSRLMQKDTCRTGEQTHLLLATILLDLLCCFLISCTPTPPLHHSPQIDCRGVLVQNWMLFSRWCCPRRNPDP